ncbi:MAG TPA: GNAT family N-acetyltransferase [Candidatus Tumulicola sp.]|jgi:ribosomal protein S18 acetylase RimI-like enzyme
MKIERATLDDTQHIIDVFRGTWAIALPYLPTLHTNEEDLEYFGSAVAKSTVYVVKDRDRIVAFCAFRTDWVDHLYILPEYARRGIGRALMGKAQAAHPRLQLWVFQRNEAAAAFYRAMGFTLVKQTGGADNEEREPDALYQWPAPFDPGSVVGVE